MAEHRSVARGYREMTLAYASDGETDSAEAAGNAAAPLPGRFFTLLPATYPTPLLRRPFAYSDADERGFSFIYEIRGEATKGFSSLETGDIVDWIGPLGKGFPNPPEDARPILAAGGIGVGPILYLARRLAADGFRPAVVLGARSADLVPEIVWPEGTDLRVCTDDGSMGIRGTVLDGLSGIDAASAAFYCCGPFPMMAAVHERAIAAGAACWVSLEETMACGVGACRGCVVETVSGYECACSDGPVFASREVSW